MKCFVHCSQPFSLMTCYAQSADHKPADKITAFICFSLCIAFYELVSPFPIFFHLCRFMCVHKVHFCMLHMCSPHREVPTPSLPSHSLPPLLPFCSFTLLHSPPPSVHSSVLPSFHPCLPFSLPSAVLFSFCICLSIHPCIHASIPLSVSPIRATHSLFLSFPVPLSRTHLLQIVDPRPLCLDRYTERMRRGIYHRNPVLNR